MSILIKGMEMPKGCNSCILKGFSLGGWVCVPTKRLAAEEAYEPKPFKERPDWCPLVELPPHGRLIDADALNELIDSGDDIDFSEVPETKYAIMQMVNEQDTILEASPYRYKMIGETDKPHGIYFIESEREDDSSR